MKKSIVLILLSGLFIASCAKKTTEEKIKDNVDEAGKGLKKLGKDLKEAAE